MRTASLHMRVVTCLAEQGSKCFVKDFVMRFSKTGRLKQERRNNLLFIICSSNDREEVLLSGELELTCGAIKEYYS